MKQKKLASPGAILAKELKACLLARLLVLGIEESELTVACVRKHRKNFVGYYSNMSQFRSRARIVVDTEYLLAHYWEAKDARLEAYRTIGHEYGHIIAEAIREIPRLSRNENVFDVPRWQDAFNGDEEQFAESFADYCCEPLTCSKLEFWETFMPKYAAEFNRIFESKDLL